MVRLIKLIVKRASNAYVDSSNRRGDVVDRIKVSSSVLGGIVGAAIGAKKGNDIGNNISSDVSEPLRTISRLSLTTSGAMVGVVAGSIVLGKTASVASRTVIAFPLSAASVACTSILALNTYGLFNQQHQKKHEKNNENIVDPAQVASFRKKNT